MSPLPELLNQDDGTIWRWSILVLLIVAAVVLGYFRTRALGTKVDEAKQAVAPVSNGFADRTKEQLEEVLRELAGLKPLVGRIPAIESKLDGHLASHADNDVRKH